METGLLGWEGKTKPTGQGASKSLWVRECENQSLRTYHLTVIDTCGVENSPEGNWCVIMREDSQFFLSKLAHMSSIPSLRDRENELVNI